MVTTAGDSGPSEHGDAESRGTRVIEWYLEVQDCLADCGGLDGWSGGCRGRGGGGGGKLGRIRNRIMARVIMALLASVPGLPRSLIISACGTHKNGEGLGWDEVSREARVKLSCSSQRPDRPHTLL